MAANEIKVMGLEIAYKSANNADYLSLTDIAKLKNADNPADVIIKWMSNKD